MRGRVFGLGVSLFVAGCPAPIGQALPRLLRCGFYALALELASFGGFCARSRVCHARFHKTRLFRFAFASRLVGFPGGFESQSQTEPGIDPCFPAGLRKVCCISIDVDFWRAFLLLNAETKSRSFAESLSQQLERKQMDPTHSALALSHNNPQHQCDR